VETRAAEEIESSDSEAEDWWDDNFFLPETVSEGSEGKYFRFMDVSPTGRFTTQDGSTAVDFLINSQGGELTKVRNVQLLYFRFRTVDKYFASLTTN